MSVGGILFLTFAISCFTAFAGTILWVQYGLKDRLGLELGQQRPKAGNLDAAAGELRSAAGLQSGNAARQGLGRDADHRRKVLAA